jgi:TetR/AcrR family transcriptional regulator, mexJK operon transcriptional repressor
MSETRFEPSTFRRGPGGRPTREDAERRHRDLIATATRLFLEKGWESTSIDEIARESGVAKRFIYARYADKAALFAGAFERFIIEKIGALHRADPLPDDVEEGLVQFGRTMLDVALSAEALAFHRLFVAEGRSFPSLVKLFAERHRKGGALGEIVHVLGTYVESGQLAPGDLEMRAEQFFILVVGIPQRLALLIGREPPANEERRLVAAVRLFLDGSRKR